MVRLLANRLLKAKMSSSILGLNRVKFLFDGYLMKRP